MNIDIKVYTKPYRKSDRTQELNESAEICVRARALFFVAINIFVPHKSIRESGYYAPQFNNEIR